MQNDTLIALSVFALFRYLYPTTPAVGIKWQTLTREATVANGSVFYLTQPVFDSSTFYTQKELFTH